MTQIETTQIKLWGRIGGIIYIDKGIAKSKGLEEGLREAFASKRVFPDGESYLVGDDIYKMQEMKDITGKMLGIEGDIKTCSGELECPIFEMSLPEGFEGDKYYWINGRIGCTIYVQKKTVIESGLEAALLEAFEHNQIIADGESYLPEGWNFEEGNGKDELLKLFKEDFAVDSYIPDGWTFK